MLDLHLLPEDQKVGGRLQRKRFCKQWSQLTRDPWVLSTIKNGLRVYPRENMIPKGTKEPKELDWSNLTPEASEWLKLVVKWKAIKRVPKDDKDEKHQIVHNLVAAVPSG